MKLTDWFPGDVKPALTGLYQREYGNDWLTKLPDYWDGRVWRYKRPEGLIATNQERRWRGLAEDPAKVKSK
jgi:hypothetical protein